tara:strand:- start:1290 stop:1400 length:111 start_codon:yes stop_codon:yes gene_type:complete
LQEEIAAEPEPLTRLPLKLHQTFFAAQPFPVLPFAS